MEIAPSPSTPSMAILYHTNSYSTISTNSSLLDIPASIYAVEDGSVKSSAASFMTTTRSESRPDTPLAYDDLYPDSSPSVRQSPSPTMLLQMRARSKSVGMIRQHNSDSIESSSI